jgi:serine/threonine protein kinase
MLVTEYMAGGAIMEYNKDLKKYIFSPSAAMILNGHGYSPDDKKEHMKLDGKTIGNESNVNTSRSMTEAEVVSVTLDLLRGLNYLHSKGICHRYVSMGLFHLLCLSFLFLFFEEHQVLLLRGTHNN